MCVGSSVSIPKMSAGYIACTCHQGQVCVCECVRACVRACEREGKGGTCGEEVGGQLACGLRLWLEVV
jgi:hypothetical protein